MFSFGKFLDRFGTEGRQIVGVSAGDEATVADAGFINPVGPGVDQIRPQARPGGHAATAHDVGLNEGPGTVTDRGDRFMLGKKLPDEAHRLFVHPKRVGIEDASGENEPVIIRGRNLMVLSTSNLSPFSS